MIQLGFQIEGEKQLSRRLKKGSLSVSQWQKTFSKTGIYLKRFFSNDVFATEGSVIGEPWEPLSEATIRQKAKRGYPSKPLVGSGRMKGSFRSVATPRMVEVYNTADYFKYHQSRQPRTTNLPRRVMMKLDMLRKQIIVKMFQKEINKNLNKK